MASRKGSEASRHVALLRGINVGGNNKLPMKDLSLLFGAAGASDVQTYIQSGNVVFTASPRAAAKIASSVEKAIAKDFGLEVPVITRTRDELARVAESNPFLARGEREDAVHVMFLAAIPTAERVAALDPKRSPGDEFVVAGRDVYLFLPNGVARTKLGNAWFDARLATVSTGRNWRTVLKLLEMVGG